MNKEALGSGIGAAAVSLASTAVPEAVPVLQQTIPLWIGAAAWYHRHKKGEVRHE